MIQKKNEEELSLTGFGKQKVKDLLRNKTFDQMRVIENQLKILRFWKIPRMKTHNKIIV